jgi:4-coumarate--CoA ligase
MSLGEFKHVLTLTSPKIIFTSKFAAEKIISLCKELNFVEKIILLDGKSRNDKIMSLRDFNNKYMMKDFSINDHVEKDVDMNKQISLILFSSGTTGLSKACQITQNNLHSIIRGADEYITLFRMIYGKDITTLNIGAWFHTFGFISSIFFGCSKFSKFVFLPKFSEKSLLRAIEKHKVNYLAIVPPIMVFLAKSPLVDQYDLSSVVEIGCGAAPLSIEVENQVRNRLKHDFTLRQGYGIR